MQCPNNGTAEVSGAVVATGLAVRVRVCHMEKDYFVASCRG